MSRFVITMTEYNRIHQIAHGVIKQVGNVEQGCIFFAIVGSYLLTKYYGIKASAVSGGFVLCVADGQKLIFYGKNEGGKFSWGNDGFHMWVETEAHVIDFMSPIYAESFAVTKPDIVIPRKMFQRRKEDDKQSIGELHSIGDYVTFPDPGLSEELIDRFLSRPANTDLLHVCETWFGSRQSKQRPTIGMGCNDGVTRNLSLPKTTARSAW